MNVESKAGILTVKYDVVAPSIGSKELNFDECGNRVRQIVEYPIADEVSLQNVLERAEEFSNIKHSTRIAIRIFLPSDRVPQIDSNVGRSFVTEAAISLDGEFSGLSLVYVGFNAEGRIPAPSIREKESEIVRRANEKPIKDAAEVIRKTMEKYDLQRLIGSISDQDHARLRQMYEKSFTSYPFNIGEKIGEMVGDGANFYVYVARSKEDGAINAVCVAEQMVLDVGGKYFIMWEMGDSAKMPEVNGLNAPLKLSIIGEAMRSNVDLVFCESRAALEAVNTINRSIGMGWRGFLPQHTLIGGEGINEGSKYGNMNVWALSKTGINNIGKQVELS